jgi:hypothetical protein
LNTKATQKTVTRIGTETIESFLREDRTLLVAVLRKDPYLLEHLRELMEVAMEFREEILGACYTLEELLPYFAEHFGVGGTPTYLLIRGGELLGALLGRNSRKALAQFVREHLELAAAQGRTGEARTMDAGAPAGTGRKSRGIR